MGWCLILESNVNARVSLNARESPGYEKTDSRVVLDISGFAVKNEAYADGSDVIQLYLTVPQMAKLVWMFFGEVASNNIYTQLLRRLLRQRWKVMTNAVAKDMSWMPRYDREI